MRKLLLASIIIFAIYGTAFAQESLTLTGDFADGTVGVKYDDKGVTSGFNYCGWEIIDGELPPGLMLHSMGNRGTGGGVYTFTNRSGTKECTITIQRNSSINDPKISGTFSNGTVGTEYSSSVTTYDGTSPYHWEYSGTLPPGLMLKGQDMDRLTLSGISEEPGTYDITLRLTDKYSSATKSLTVTINSGSSGITEPGGGYEPTEPGENINNNEGVYSSGGGGGCNTGFFGRLLLRKSRTHSQK